STLAPGPVIVTSRSIVSWALVSPIGLTTEPILNVIVDAPHATASASRTLPAPLSAFVVTTGSVVHGRVIVAVADPLLRPVPTLSTAPCTWKLPGADESGAGVNFSPAF